MAISLKSTDEISRMREAGRHVAEVLHILAAMVRPGLVVADLDAAVRDEYARRGLTATFLHYQPHPNQPPYPSTVCVSINDQIVHGIPGTRVLQDGDVVKLDLGATYRGYVGDSAITVGCGTLSAASQRLIDVTDDSLRLAIEQSRAGGRLGDIGAVIQRRIEGCGMSVIKNYGGHGVGRSMHEEPFVPNHGTPGTGRRLKPGMVIAIEPMATLGGDESFCADDGWTVSTSDGSLASHFEHTVAITKNGPLILTAP
ncbi:MAG: type I methionyl aminopeptidase [Dehalococcoidia bacterium]